VQQFIDFSTILAKANEGAPGASEQIPIATAAFPPKGDWIALHVSCFLWLPQERTIDGKELEACFNSDECIEAEGVKFEDEESWMGVGCCFTS
jgi:hypothetical protein